MRIRTRARPAFLLFVALASWFFLTATAESPVGDAYQPFVSAIRMIRGRGLPESKVMPGQTFLLVPTAIASKWIVDHVPDEGRRFPLMILVTNLFPAVLTAGTAAIVLGAARALGHSARGALFTALVFALATPAAVYAKNFFPQTAEALFLAGSVAGLLVARRKAIEADAADATAQGRARDDRIARSARIALALSGLAYGALLLVKAVGVVHLPALATFVLLLRWQRSGGARSLGTRAAGAAHVAAASSPRVAWPRREAAIDFAWWAMPAFALALLYLPYNRIAHGGMLDFGYGLERDAYWGFSTGTLTGLYGLLLSPGKGLFFYAPVLVLAMPGIARLWRRDRLVAFLLAAAPLGALLLHAHWWAWHGDNAWGPRYLVPVMPMLALAAAEAWRCGHARGSFRRAKSLALVALCALSIGVQTLGASFTNNAYQTLTYDTVIPQYRPEMGPSGPRDDELHLHWIPEFSPIAGHAWLARHALRGDSAGAYLRDYPWRALRPDGAWAPRVPEPPPPLDYWVLRLPRIYPSAEGLLRLIAIAVVLALAASIGWLVAEWRTRTESAQRT